jgi:hypothetical protein
MISLAHSPLGAEHRGAMGYAVDLGRWIGRSADQADSLLGQVSRVRQRRARQIGELLIGQAQRTLQFNVRECSS